MKARCIHVFLLSLVFSIAAYKVKITNSDVVQLRANATSRPMKVGDISNHHASNEKRRQFISGRVADLLFRNGSQVVCTLPLNRGEDFLVPATIEAESKGGAQFVNYRLDGCLGGGASGEAWTATDTSSSKTVVLKVMRKGIDSEIQRECARECAFGHSLMKKLASREERKFFVDCLSFGEAEHQDSKYNIEVQEHAEGESLLQVFFFGNQESPPKKFPNLQSMMTVAVQMIELFEVMMATTKTNMIRHFHQDLQIQNILAGSDHLVAIDYGSSKVCCEGKPEKCETDYPAIVAGGEVNLSIEECKKEDVETEYKMAVTNLVDNIALLLCDPAHSDQIFWANSAEKLVKLVRAEYLPTFEEIRNKTNKEKETWLLENILKPMFEEKNEYHSSDLNYRVWPPRFKDAILQAQAKLGPVLT